VGEADFGAVDGAIADGFDEDERVVVARIEDDLLEGVLGKERVVLVWIAVGSSRGMVCGMGCTWRDLREDMMLSAIGSA
jgi:hypothetical protein